MVYRWILLGALVFPFVTQAEAKKWESAFAYFESEEALKATAPLVFKPVQLTEKELREQFFDRHWTSFVLCNRKKMDIPDKKGKLTDFFSGGFLTQWRYPEYDLRKDDRGHTRFAYDATSYNYVAYVADGYINSLVLYFSGWITDHLVIQPYIFELTGEMVFVYNDREMDALMPICQGAVSIFVQPPLS